MANGDAIVTPTEIDRIMAAVESVRAEVKLLRADLNGRVRRLELWQAEAKGRIEGASGVKAGVVVILGILVPVASIMVGTAVALLA